MQNKTQDAEYQHDTGELVAFQFVRSARKTVALHVHQDGHVIVRAPLRFSLAHAYTFIRERWDWLQLQQQRLSRLPKKEVFRYEEGALLSHLGEPLRLTIQQGKRAHVEKKESDLWVTVSEWPYQESQLAILVQRWQLQQAKLIFAERLQQGHDAMASLALPKPSLKIRKMRSRWGSCSRQASITLNLELIKMPLPCIDYVVIHELCHLIEFNHSPAFYALQSRFMPDWKARKQQLEALAR
jgi:hypothetical protein